MTEQELRKEYNEKWKKENPTKYVVWLICYIGDLIPIVIAVVQMVGGLTDEKVGTMMACLAAILVLSIIAAVLSMDQKKGWKKYREENQHRLK